MNKYFDEDLIEKFCHNELRRRDLDDRQRGMVCKGMMELRGFTQAQLSREYGVHRARISDWIREAEAMDEQEYAKLKKDGATKFDINRELRSRTKKDRMPNGKNLDYQGVSANFFYEFYSFLKKTEALDPRHNHILGKIINQANRLMAGELK